MSFNHGLFKTAFYRGKSFIQLVIGGSFLFHRLNRVRQCFQVRSAQFGPAAFPPMENLTPVYLIFYLFSVTNQSCRAKHLYFEVIALVFRSSPHRAEEFYFVVYSLSKNRLIWRYSKVEQLDYEALRLLVNTKSFKFNDTITFFPSVHLWLH